jgi:hypothetical protein
MAIFAFFRRNPGLPGGYFKYFSIMGKTDAPNNALFTVS